MITGSVSKTAFAKGFRLRDYCGVLNIPAKRSGRYAIEHFTKPPHERIEISNTRAQIMGGQASGFVQYDHATRWHKLVGPSGTWMTDLPVEQVQHDEALKNVTKGRVLVGGLGLGYAVQLLAKRKGIQSIVVVEIAPDVIKLVKPALRRTCGDDWHKVTIINEDLLKWLAKRQSQKVRAFVDQPFDHAFYDIWQSDGEGTFHDLVVPLLELSRGVVATRPICWNEDVMRGQLFHGLLSQIHYRELVRDGNVTARMLVDSPKARTRFGINAEELPESDPAAKYVNWRVPFLKWLDEAKPATDRAQHAAQHYASIYGSARWRQSWELFVSDPGQHEQSVGGAA